MSIQRQPIRSTPATNNTSPGPKREFRVRHAFRLLVPVAPEMPTSRYMGSGGTPASRSWRTWASGSLPYWPWAWRLLVRMYP